MGFYMHRIKENALFLIDGSYILYRSYYGLRPLYTSDGTPTQAIYGFCRAIKTLIDKFDPKNLVLVWDSKGKTFRSEVYEQYKATRQVPPSDLFIQKDQIQEFAKLIGLFQVSKTGYEADDLIASLVEQNKKGQSIIVGPDKDLYQLITDEDVMIYDSFNDKMTDESDFRKERGFGPEKLRFYHSLLGDASDNIPGVKGIGKKGAEELVKKFDSLQDLYENLDKVKTERMRNALIENKDNALLSHKLFGLEAYKLDLKKSDLKFNKNNWINAAPIFRKLEFKRLLKDLEKSFGLGSLAFQLIEKGEDKKQEQEKIEVKKPRIEVSSQIKEMQETIDFDNKTKMTKDDWTCKIITSQEDLKDLILKLKKEKEFAFDTETEGLKPLQHAVLGLSISFDKKKSYYLPFVYLNGNKEENKNIFAQEKPVLDKGQTLKLLKPIFEDPKIKKIAQNAKFDCLSLVDDDIEVKGLNFDTLIAASLLREGDWQKINLKALSLRYLNEKMTTFKDLLGKKYKTFADIPLKEAAEYASHDSLQTYKLKFILSKDLDKQKRLKNIFEKLEMPLSFVLIDMEKTGIAIDLDILKELSKKVRSRLNSMHDKIIEAIKSNIDSNKFKEEFNLNSSKQVEYLLFDVLQLPVIKKSGKGQRSTDQEVLSKLGEQHPIPNLILKYRELFKLLNTYIDPLQKDVNPKTKRIHTSFSQTMVVTGRLSSSNPNLQNIPATPGYGMEIRSAFVAPKGRSFLSADYSQMELRVLAHMSKDKNLCDAFKNDIDIHTQTSAQLFNVPVDKVTNEQRQVGKRINFSIIYGLTPYGLSKDLNIKPSDAKEYIDKYFEQYPKVAQWIEKTVKEAKKNGYVETWMGRKRYLPGLMEKNRMLYEAAKRMATNSPVQGTSAEIIKLAMIELHRAFETKKIDAKIVLQIHDELLIEYDSKKQQIVEKMVKECLENVVKWEIPFKVTIRTGNNWQQVSK